MHIVGGTEDFILEKKTKIAPKKVRCITVNNDQHIFKIAVSKDPTWVGGTEYNNTSLLVYNTGGGKSIYINQEIETQEWSCAQLKTDNFSGSENYKSYLQAYLIKI